MSPPAERNAVLTATRAVVGVAARSLSEAGADVTLANTASSFSYTAARRRRWDSWPRHVMPSTVTRVCDLLVAKGYIRREPAMENRRVVHAELTGPGRALLEQVTRRREALIDDALARMSRAARKSLAHGLAEFSDALGEVSDAAWTLGWSVGSEAGGTGAR